MSQNFKNFFNQLRSCGSPFSSLIGYKEMDGFPFSSKKKYSTWIVIIYPGPGSETWVPISLRCGYPGTRVPIYNLTVV